MKSRKWILLCCCVLLFSQAGCQTENTVLPAESASHSVAVSSDINETPLLEPSGAEPLSQSIRETLPQESSKIILSQTESAPPEAVRISISVEGRVISAELDDSAIAKEFEALLPQTLSMQRVGGGREFYGSIDGSLNYDETDAQTTFENGALAYWFSGNGLCLLYDNQVADPEIGSGVIILGKMTSDYAFLRELDDHIEVTVTLTE